MEIHLFIHSKMDSIQQEAYQNENRRKLKNIISHFHLEFFMPFGFIFFSFYYKEAKLSRKNEMLYKSIRVPEFFRALCTKTQIPFGIAPPGFAPFHKEYEKNKCKMVRKRNGEFLFDNTKILTEFPVQWLKR